MKKKLLSILVIAATFAFVACGNKTSNVAVTEAAKVEETTAAKSMFKVGIGQFAEHGSLDNCRNGFIEGMKEKVDKERFN